MVRRFSSQLSNLMLCGVLLSSGVSYGESGYSSSGCEGGYSDQRTSEYILPYSIGSAFIVGQGNCTDGSHSDDQKYAYDFDMPIGTPIVASRAGTVLAIEERYEDSTQVSGEENFVLIEHDDGTVAGYFHLTQDGALVEEGDDVALGEMIGLSGDSGDSTEPHLHFEVLECQDCDSLPVNFSNTRAHTNGLVDEEYYEALEF